jgi:hypothetical protein
MIETIQVVELRISKVALNSLDLETSMPIGTLQNGLYLLEIQAKDKQATFHKLIIQH